MRTLEGPLDGAGLRVAIVVSRFNELITERLLQGAVAAAREHGIADDALDVVWVPGAFELPAAARWLAQSGRYDAIACMGAVIRGETPHFDYVAGEAARGISAAAREFELPVTFGVVTANTVEQARARAGGAVGNRGREAMLAAIEMATLRVIIAGTSAGVPAPRSGAVALPGVAPADTAPAMSGQRQGGTAT